MDRVQVRKLSVITRGLYALETAWETRNGDEPINYPI